MSRWLSYIVPAAQLYPLLRSGLYCPLRGAVVDEIAAARRNEIVPIGHNEIHAGA